MRKKIDNTCGIFGILIGCMMVGQWTMFILTGQVLELQTAPLSIGFHLAAEIATALGLVISGIAIIKRIPWGKISLLVANGLLIYSVLASPGYFAQSGQWEMVIMFAVILVLAVFITIIVAKDLLVSR